MDRLANGFDTLNRKIDRLDDGFENVEEYKPGPKIDDQILLEGKEYPQQEK